MAAAPELVAWFAQIKLEEYVPVFATQGLITLADCKTIDDKTLDACGVDKIGHRKRLLKAVANLNDHEETVQEQQRGAGPMVPPRGGGATRPPRPTVRSTTLAVGTATIKKPPKLRALKGGAPAAAAAPAPNDAPASPATPGSASVLPLPPKRTAPKSVAGGGSPADVDALPPLPVRAGSRKSVMKRQGSSASTGSATSVGSAGSTTSSGRRSSGWNPANAKAATPSRIAQARLKKMGPPRPPLPIHRPQRPPAKAAAAAAKPMVPVNDDDDDDDDADYLALPMPNRVSYHDSDALKQIRMCAVERKDVSERTKQGFLSKKGGKAGTKGWDKRWFDLSGGELKYFRDKEKKPNGVIPVNQMVDIRPTVSGNAGGKHSFRFELDTPDRTYYLSADTVAEMTEWMMLIGAFIQAEKKDGKSETVGGDMGEPDKAGWLLVRGKDLRQKWIRHYLAIKGDTMCLYTSYDDFAKERPLHTINFLFVNLKTPVPGSKKDRNHQFQVLTNGPTFECRAENAGELKNVVSAIQTGIQYAYSQMSSDKTTKSEKIPNAKALEMMRENASNMVCVDCGASKPDWASINLGIVFCLECCGIHRGLGVHITKCRSAMMDEWNETLISVLVAIGNRTSNTFWEGSVPDGVKIMPTATKEDRAAYIRRKYVDREFVAFRKDVSEYTVQSMKLGLSSDDLMLTLEHIIAGIGPKYPGAGAVLAEADKLGATTHIEVLAQNGFETMEGGTDERPREAFEMSAEDGVWKPVWLEYCAGALNIFASADQVHPDHCVPGGILTAVTGVDAHFKVTLATPIVLASTQISLRPLAPASTEPWVAFLSDIIANLTSASSMFDFESCSKVGTLTRIGAQGVPQKARCFAVRDKELRYFTSIENPQELGCIDCATLRSIVPGVVPGSLGEGTVFESDGALSLISDDAVFVLDATTSQAMLSWVAALRNTQVFGASIDSHSTTVPFVVDQCCTFLENQMGVFDQLYAQPGDPDRIDELRIAFNRDDDRCQLLTSGGYTAHDAASLLQLFFMDLPKPLIPPSVLGDLAEVADLDFASLASLELPPRLVETIRHLPDANRDTLNRMYQHVHYIAEACPEYGEGDSTLDRLACVFGPLLFGLDESNEANETSVTLAVCCAKLLLTHESLAPQ
eukprot:CAMPEP_0206333220 /NCGR_PEP_ID=MMETSP0106_2-20121207/25167_1 /ASSEMBLY_ACC=CAM_ASM_000206 /TAXON_ID=81532 /ORGANISM="Acanthoeca-like sp., Strain 10tr" /LENGTH=1143 /DNA_ID=CAMNT_0053766093 /DNA_START=46 /DNA_END=3478 /DNA_ORIENTATION=+